MYMSICLDKKAPFPCLLQLILTGKIFFNRLKTTGYIDHFFHMDTPIILKIAKANHPLLISVSSIYYGVWEWRIEIGSDLGAASEPSLHMIKCQSHLSWLCFWKNILQGVLCTKWVPLLFYTQPTDVGSERLGVGPFYCHLYIQQPIFGSHFFVPHP